MKTYTNPVYRYTRPAELDAPGDRRPVVIVGAGPVGLAAAIDLGQRGIPVVVLDEDRTVSVGSRAICYAKRALEILDRLGCAQPVVAKGIGWNVGKVFFRDELVYRFDLLPEAGHRRPAFINLQQYWLEEYLVERATSLSAVDVRWESKAVGVLPQTDGVSVRVATPDGEYALACDWLIVADGSRSACGRCWAGMGRPGLSRPLPHRRHPHESDFRRALVLVRPAVPPEPVGAAAPPGRRRVAHRFPAGLGRRSRRGRSRSASCRACAPCWEDAEFEIEWASVYTFQCRRMQLPPRLPGSISPRRQRSRPQWPCPQ
jgi:3-(3-hydroxy-phenyl)propionate hydroxylase